MFSLLHWYSNRHSSHLFSTPLEASSGAGGLNASRPTCAIFPSAAYPEHTEKKVLTMPVCFTLTLTANVGITGPLQAQQRQLYMWHFACAPFVPFC
jgi:hypothetical protein